jgi:hypothetical protein
VRRGAAGGENRLRRGRRALPACGHDRCHNPSSTERGEIHDRAYAEEAGRTVSAPLPTASAQTTEASEIADDLVTAGFLAHDAQIVDGVADIGHDGAARLRASRELRPPDPANVGGRAEN